MSEINFRDAGNTQKLAELESKLSALESALEAHELKSEEFINPFHADLLRRLDERLIDEENDQEDDENEEEAEIGELDQSFIQVVSSGSEFSVHWITVDSNAETPSFESIDEIDTFEKVQQAFKEAVEYRDLENNVLRKVNHGDIMVLLSRADPNVVLEEDAAAAEEDAEWLTTWDGRQACYYIGQVANVSGTVQDAEPVPGVGERHIAGKADALHEGDSREIVVWEHCTFADGTASLTYVASVSHAIESRFEDLVIVGNYRGVEWAKELGIEVDEETSGDTTGDAVYDVYAKEILGRATLSKGRVVKIENQIDAGNEEWTEAHKVGSIYVPAAPIRYSCGPDGCEPDPGGDFETLEECEAACTTEDALPEEGGMVRRLWQEVRYMNIGVKPELVEDWDTKTFPTEAAKQNYKEAKLATIDDAIATWNSRVDVMHGDYGFEAQPGSYVDIFEIYRAPGEPASFYIKYPNGSMMAWGLSGAQIGGGLIYSSYTGYDTLENIDGANVGSYTAWGTGLPGGPSTTNYNKQTGELVSDEEAVALTGISLKWD